MSRISILLLALISIGCLPKKARDKSDERYFHFSSVFPPDIHWKVISHFKSTSDKSRCKSTSLNTGELEPDRKTAAHPLKTSGDTVSVPLFWSGSSDCEWELTDISLQDDSDRCTRLHAILITEDKGPDREYAEDPILPDTLAFDCPIDSASGCYRCKEKTGKVELAYRMKPGPETKLFVHLDVE